MDICLSETKNGTFIEPINVYGILWLQTHFESTHWESISEGRVKIPTKDAQMLYEDAILAGINVTFIKTLVNSFNF